MAQTLYPEQTGGGAYHVHAMSRDQAERGHDVTVATTRRDASLPRVEEREGYAVRRFDAPVDLLGNEVSPGLAAHLRHADDIDVVHAHSHIYLSTNLAALQRRFDDTPLAITNHGLYSQTAPEWLFDLYLRTLGRWTFDQADLAFCYTDDDRERLRRLGVETPVEVVPNGIDTDRFGPRGPASDLVDADGPVVLFVGRLVDGKRPQDAVAAVGRLREALPEATLYVCGDGPLAPDLRARAAELPDDAVRFLGHVDYEEMPAVYRAADALVLPSRCEGVPRTVLEALASGVPVVCSSLPQLEALASEGLTTVEVGDVAGFAEGLRRAIEADRDVGLAEEYRWASTVEGTTEALRGLVAGPDRDPVPGLAPPTASKRG